MSARAILVAAPASGTGKTTVTAGLLRALRRRGGAVRAAKAGPDYIDPAFLAAASGHECINLDSWAMAPALLDGLLAGLAVVDGLVIIEAAMGLFDGIGGAGGRSGAAADLAARYRLPVLLVLDISGQAQTAAAVARGLAGHDPEVRVAGMLLNRVASERHRAFAADAIAALGLPVVGAIPRDPRLALPSRHLGLVQAGEHDDLAARLDGIADVVAGAVDLDAVVALAAPLDVTAPARPALPPPGKRIALARDAAFSFIYPHLLAGWRQAGAAITPFSPLADQPPPADCDCCWLPGGYPELHAARLAAAGTFRAGLAAFAATRPVHGECGGYMVLGQWLEDAEGVFHPMAGLLGHGTSFARRRLTLGYREARLIGAGPLGGEGALIRGHEFHYATLAAPARDDARFAELRDGQGRDIGAGGSRRGLVSGTFFHAIAAG